jgi:hypothetical protein
MENKNVRGLIRDAPRYLPGGNGQTQDEHRTEQPVCGPFVASAHTVTKKWVTPRLKKAKAIPLQPWTGPEGSIRLRLPGFKTVGT